MPWFNPAPAPSGVITSTWGNAIENAAQPTFATKAALDAGWNDAPDGASAFVLADRRTYRRRGGAWLLPIEAVQGVKVNRFPGPSSGAFVPVVAAPGAMVGSVGPFALKGRRIYAVSLALRLGMTSAVTNQTLGMHLNFAGTSADVPLTWHGGAPPYSTGGGQEAAVGTQPFPYQNAVVEQNYGGVVITGGADDADLNVIAQLVLNNSTATFTVSGCFITCVDVGAAA